MRVQAQQELNKEKLNSVYKDHIEHIRKDQKHALSLSIAKFLEDKVQLEIEDTGYTEITKVELFVLSRKQQLEVAGLLHQLPAEFSEIVFAIRDIFYKNDLE